MEIIQSIFNHVRLTIKHNDKWYSAMPLKSLGLESSVRNVIIMYTKTSVYEMLPDRLGLNEKREFEL